MNGFGGFNSSATTRPAAWSSARRHMSRGFCLIVPAAILFANFGPQLSAQGTRRTTFADGRDREEGLPEIRRPDVDPANRRQDPRDLERRNRLINDLKNDFRDFGKNDFDNQPSIRRSRPVSGAAIVESREVLDNARRLIDGFSQEAERLQVALTNDVDYIRGVRSVVGDVIQFSANARVISDRCQREGRLASLRPDFESIDRDWQAISYKLRQIPELSRTASIQRIQRMDDFDRQLNEIFKVQPQFDQRELLRQTAALGSQLQRLGEDINLELVDVAQRQALCGYTHRCQSQVQMVCDSIDSGYDPSAVSTEYKRFQELWYPLAKQLRTVDINRSLERTVMRVNQSNRDIGELLRMPPQNDTDNLGYMMEAMKRDIDEYFTRAPLKLLMELPEARTALVTASEFYGVCEQFLQDAAGNASQSQLAESFHYVADAWRGFEHTFRPMNNDAARRVLNRVEERINAVADALQLYDQPFDRRKVLDLAYALQVSAENIARDTRSWVERDQIEFGREAVRETESFTVHCQQFSDVANRNATIDQLRREISSLYEHYKRVYGYISQCRGRERARLGENAARTKSALVDLRTLLEI